jgi:hypothetical protein
METRIADLRVTRYRNTLVALIVCFGLASSLWASRAKAAGFRLVAKTGDTAPIAGGTATLSGITGAEINAQGDVLYSSYLQLVSGVEFGNNRLLVVERPNGTDRLVSRTGSTAAGAPDDSVFTGFGRMMISDMGDVAFEADMDPLSTDPVFYDTLWTESNGLHLVDYGKSEGPLWGSYHRTVLRIDDMDHSGRVLYTKYSEHSSGSVLTFGHETWWLVAPGTSNRLVVTEGSTHAIPPAPSFTYSYIFDTPKLANDGRVVFAAQLTGIGIDTTNNDTIWVDESGGKYIIFRDGDPAPGLASEVVFTQVRDSISNETGQVAFKATIAGPGIDATNSRALFSTAGGALHHVAGMGQSVPGVGMLSDTLYLQDIAGASTSFWGTYLTDGGGSFGEGIFAEKNGTLRTIVRSGQQIPNSEYFMFTSSGSAQAVPGTDRFAVHSYVRDIDFASYSGVWIENEDYELLPVIVGGSQVPVGGKMKTAEWVWMGEFSSQGELPLTIHFTDDTSAVFVWDGKLSSLAVAGDYDGNGKVDAADYTLWRDTLGSTSDMRANGDNSGASSGVIDQADYTFWKTHFGSTPFSDIGVGSLTAVPEPTFPSLGFWIIATAVGMGRQRARTR